jgi:hypothetical protein
MKKLYGFVNFFTLIVTITAKNRTSHNHKRELLYAQFKNSLLELVPTLMIDDAETKMRTEAALLCELKTSVPFYHTLQICGLIYVDIYLATGL